MISCSKICDENNKVQSLTLTPKGADDEMHEGAVTLRKMPRSGGIKEGREGGPCIWQPLSSKIRVRIRAWSGYASQ